MNRVISRFLSLILAPKLPVCTAQAADGSGLNTTPPANHNANHGNPPCGGGRTAFGTASSRKYAFSMPALKSAARAVFAKRVKPPANSFVDVKEDDFFYDAVQWAVENGITSGTSATTFRPKANCTRAQITTFLWRAAGSPAPKSRTMPFTDVAAGSYYEAAVLWALEQGITSGTSATTFSPGTACTRSQSVTFLYWAAGSPSVPGSTSFRDVEDSAYYADAVSWAERSGVTKGAGGGRFGPAADCTRAQAITFLYRWLAK